MTPYVAPELLTGGLAAATSPADVYALCATLTTLFTSDDPLAGKAREALTQGCRSQPTERATLTELATALDQLQGVAPPVVELPAPDYWDEDTLVPVSYTHLDVYKRQRTGCSILAVSTTNAGCTPGASSPLARSAPIRRRNGWPRPSVIPVSYTHLDVYKRQVPASGRRPAGIPPQWRPAQSPAD